MRSRPELSHSASATRRNSVARDAADLLDHLGRVAREVALQDLEHAARVLSVWSMPSASGASSSTARRELLARPAAADVDALVRHDPGSYRRFRVPPAEQAVEVFGVAEILADDRRRVGVVHDVVAEVALVLDDVVDDPAEERDVAAGADRDVDVGDRARPREPRIDVDDRRAARLGLHHPPEADRVALGHVRALDDDAVAVLQVLLEGRARRRDRSWSPDRGPSRNVICAPGSRSGSTPSAVNSFLMR